jgi:dihydrodipicolinate synthase/N-acetylneuraminate lyase
VVGLLGCRAPPEPREADALRDAGRAVLTADGVRSRLAEGLVIPAHPLALTAERTLDERRQRALTRYYLEAGAGGLAVGVHTTQFAIRDPAVGLYGPVLELAAQTARERGSAPVLVAGIIGDTSQAVAEAETAVELGYDAGLLGLGALGDADDDELLAHCRAVAEVIPVFGFYLQPAAGGRPLEHSFWRRFVEIEQVVAIKVAPFDRYRTLAVARAVVEAGRAGLVALYTGNDDAILFDLLSTYRFDGGSAGFVGGLLGQWAVGTRRAVELLESVKRWRGAGAVPDEALTLAQELTDTNAALFDVAHAFRGCIAGIHEVLRAQGLMLGRWCLDPGEDLSPGQCDEIARVREAYPHLHDDAFVAEHLDAWLG